MSKLRTWLARPAALILSAAMVITGLPADVFAAPIVDDDVIAVDETLSDPDVTDDVLLETDDGSYAGSIDASGDAEENVVTFVAGDGIAFETITYQVGTIEDDSFVFNGFDSAEFAEDEGTVKATATIPSGSQIKVKSFTIDNEDAIPYFFSVGEELLGGDGIVLGGDTGYTADAEVSVSANAFTIAGSGDNTAAIAFDTDSEGAGVKEVNGTNYLNGKAVSFTVTPGEGNQIDDVFATQIDTETEVPVTAPGEGETAYTIAAADVMAAVAAGKGIVISVDESEIPDPTVEYDVTVNKPEGVTKVAYTQYKPVEGDDDTVVGDADTEVTFEENETTATISVEDGNYLVLEYTLDDYHWLTDVEGATVIAGSNKYETAAITDDDTEVTATTVSYEYNNNSVQITKDDGVDSAEVDDEAFLEVESKKYIPNADLKLNIKCKDGKAVDEVGFKIGEEDETPKAATYDRESDRYVISDTHIARAAIANPQLPILVDITTKDETVDVRFAVDPEQKDIFTNVALGDGTPVTFTAVDAAYKPVTGSEDPAYYVATITVLKGSENSVFTVTTADDDIYFVEAEVKEGSESPEITEEDDLNEFKVADPLTGNAIYNLKAYSIEVALADDTNAEVEFKGGVKEVTDSSVTPAKTKYYLTTAKADLTFEVTASENMKLDADDPVTATFGSDGTEYQLDVTPPATGNLYTIAQKIGTEDPLDNLANVYDGYDYTILIGVTEEPIRVKVKFTITDDIATLNFDEYSFVDGELIENLKTTALRVEDFAASDAVGEEGEEDYVPAKPKNEATVEVDKGNVVVITDIFMPDGNDYSVVNTVTSAGTALEITEEEGEAPCFRTAPIVDETAPTTVSITSAKFDAEKVVLTNPDTEATLTVADDVVATVNEGTEGEPVNKKYVKRVDSLDNPLNTDFVDVEFMLAPAADKLINDIASYKAGEGEAVKIDLTAADAEGEFSGKIAAKDIRAAAIADPQADINVTADVVDEADANKVITVKVNKVNGVSAFASLEYQEYKHNAKGEVVTAGELQTVVIGEDTTEGEETIGGALGSGLELEIPTGHVVAFSATAADGVLLFSDSVKDGEEVIAPYEEAVDDDDYPGENGSYLVTADQARTVSFTGYAPVDVTVTEADNGKDGDEKADITVSDVTSGVEADKTTGGEISLTVGYADPLTPYDVLIEGVTAKYQTNDGEGGAPVDHEIPVSFNKKTCTATIAQGDVETCIKAANAIRIEVKASLIEKINYKLNISDEDQAKIDDIVIQEFAPNANMLQDAPVMERYKSELEFTDGVAAIEAQKGNKVRIASISHADVEDPYNPGEYFEDDSFIKVTRTVTKEDGTTEEKQIGSYTTTANWSLGVIEADDSFTVSLATLNIDDVALTVSNAEEFEGKILPPYAYINMFNEGFQISMSLASSDTMNSYTFTDIKYAIGDGTPKTASIIHQSKSGAETYVFVKLSLKDTYEAAFASVEAPKKKINVTAKYAAGGYQDQSLDRLGDSFNSSLSVKDASGKEIVSSLSALTGEDTEYTVKYNTKASVTVSPVDGFAPTALYLISETDKKVVDDNTDIADKIAGYKTKASKEENKYVPDEDGVISASIDKMTESWYYIVEEEDAYYVKVTSESAETVTAGLLTPLDVEANYAIEYTVEIMKGESSVEIDSITAAILETGAEETSTDVKDKTINAYPHDPFESGETEFYFSGSDKDIQGRTVHVTFTEKLPDGSADTAVTGTVIFNVNKAFDDSKLKVYTVSGETETVYNEGDGFTLDIGGSIELLSEGIADAEVKPVVSLSDDIKDYATVTVAKDGKITVKADAARELLTKDEGSLIIADPSYDGSVIMIPITFSTDKVTEAAVTAAAEGGFSDIFVTLTNDVTGIDGLYYVVCAASDDPGTEFKDKVYDIVPATQSKVTLSVGKNSESFSADPVTYTVTAKLVQISNIAGYEFNYRNGMNVGAFTVAEKEASVADGGSLDAATVVDGTFATSVKVTRSKAAPKKIYTHMGEIHLADVSFLIGSGRNATAPTVQKLKSVTITGNGINYTWTPEYGSMFIGVKGNAISIDTGFLQKTGTYTLTAYAAEPMGKDVSGSYKFKVNKGIEALGITANPTRVYKASNKKVTVKTSVIYNGGNKANKPAAAKVKYFLVPYDYNVRDEGAPTANLLNVKDISVSSKGVVTIGKKADIGEGLIFYVVAVANDYSGNTVCNYTAITVTGTKNAISRISVRDNATGMTTDLVDGQSYKSSELIGSLCAFQSIYEYIPASYTIKGAGAKITKYTGGGTGINAITKTGELKITAKATDGSKASKTIKVKVIPDDEMEFELYDNAGNMIADTNTEATDTVINRYVSGQPMYLVVSGEEGSLISNKVSVDKKVGKITSKGVSYSYKAIPYEYGEIDYGYYSSYGYKYRIDKDGSYTAYYLINPLKSATEIKISAGGVTRTVNVTNAAISSATKTSVSAASAHVDASGKITKRKGAIFNALYFADAETYEKAGSPNRVTYTIKTGSGKNAALYNGDVLITMTKDYSSTVYNAGTTEYEKNQIGQIIGGLGNAEIEPVDGDANTTYRATVTDGKLVIDYVDENGRFNVPKGTYKFTITPVNGEGVATAKSATVSLKAAPAPKAQIQLKTSTFKTFGTKQELALKSLKNICRLQYEDGGEIVTEQCYDFIGLKGVNIGGTINRFGKGLFELVQNDTTKKNSTLAYTSYERPVAADGYVGKKGKEAFTGWVTVTSTGLDGQRYSQMVKVTLKKVTALTPEP